MKKVYYEKGLSAISDYDIRSVVDSLLNDPDEHSELHISTAMVIDEIRARIAEGSLNTDVVTVFVEGELFEIDKDGRSFDWSEPLDVHMKTLSRILRGNKFKT